MNRTQPLQISALSMIVLGLLAMAQPAAAATIEIRSSPRPNVEGGVGGALFYRTNSPQILGGYVGFAITMEAGDHYDCLWVKLIPDFSEDPGHIPIVRLAYDEGATGTEYDRVLDDGLFHVCTMDEGEEALAWFYLEIDPTLVTDKAPFYPRVELYEGFPLPDASNRVQFFDNLTHYTISTLNASANQVFTVIQTPPDPYIGASAYLAVCGKTGNIASQGVLAGSPATAVSGANAWPAEVLVLQRVFIEEMLTGDSCTTAMPGAPIATDHLGEFFPNGDSFNYRILYQFRISGILPDPLVVSPRNYITSGKPTKYEVPSEPGTIPQIVTSNVLVAKSAFETVDPLNTDPVNLGTEGGEVTYVVEFTADGDGTKPIEIDEIVDFMPLIGGSTFPTYLGPSYLDEEEINDPEVNDDGSLVWHRPFLVYPGETIALTYELSFPGTIGVYRNEAIGIIDPLRRVQIDTTYDLEDDNPAWAEVRVGIVCGDGELAAPWEECDWGEDNSDTEPNACRSTCMLPSCGDGVVDDDFEEECDEGEWNSDTEPDACRTECVWHHCGDGVLDSDEQCDGTFLGEGYDQCPTGYVGTPLCNNDPDNTDGNGTCTLDEPVPDGCVEIEGCGNGKLEGEEGCDDGNAADGDGCSAACQVEYGFDCLDPDPATDGTVENPDSVCNSTCGDGQLASDEGCDDGNTADFDGCSAICLIEYGFDCLDPDPLVDGTPESPDSLCASDCGDGRLASNEGCDDGNTADFDGCSALCETEYGFDCLDPDPEADGTQESPDSLCASTCGDGRFAFDEECDDGNTADFDGCSAICLIEYGFDCLDPYPLVDGTQESPDSVCASECGDGMLASNEGCDDGNTWSEDGCSALCQVEYGFDCQDPYPLQDGSRRSPDSVCESECGDGRLASDEGCDDGNTDSDDGCSSTCVMEDGYLCEGEGDPENPGSPDNPDSICGDVNECTLGTHNCDPNATCTDTALGFTCTCNPGFYGDGTTCQTLCGDGITAGEEACDDGDTDDGDGCSATCLLEDGWDCSGSPSICTTTCGDGITTGWEECDDGNTDDGDGCSGECEWEDNDHDGVVDNDDNCPDVYNPEQNDAYGTTAGDACEDTDGDGLLDIEEDPNGNGFLDEGETDPTNPDSDGDGIDDHTELYGETGTDPLNPDSDGDGLCDGPLTVRGGCVGGEDMNANGKVDNDETDPTDKDSDDDGLTDGDEVLVHQTDPLDPDSDDDGIFDGTELGRTAEDLTEDTDLEAGHFVPDADPSTTTDPLNHDTDFGGVTDGLEDVNGNGRIDPGETDPLWPDDDQQDCIVPNDCDDDGLTNDEELELGIDPFNPDTDGDGLADLIELQGENPTDPDDPDTDGDGLCDGPLDIEGICAGGEDANANGRVDPGETDPNLFDTDGGGMGDGEEVRLDRDPLDRYDDKDYQVVGGRTFGCSVVEPPDSTGWSWSLPIAALVWALRRRRAR